LFCLVLYWPGLLVWFHDDDFAFLPLFRYIHNWRDLREALFQPTIHGTWRPLSERAYFIGVQALFGIPHARPFRVIAFLTQFANMILIGAITLRLTRLRVAGFVAPILWIANSALVTVMVWNCAFMYALCALVFLSSFWFLLRYIETNSLRYYAALWGIFLIGFLVNETDIVLPLLLASYALLCARPYFLKTLPLFVPSIVFFVAHQLLIPKQASGPYTMHFDAGIFETLWAYWASALTPLLPPIFPRFPWMVASAGFVLFAVALGGFVLVQAWRRNLLPAFLLAWFAILLAPVLPLRDHFTDYYLTLPIIGIAMLGAYGFATAWRGRIVWKSAAVALLVLYLCESVPSARGAARWNLDRSQYIKHLVLGVADAHRRAPDKTILLDGISDVLFDTAVSQSCFRFLSVDEVYLAPGSEPCLATSVQQSDVDRFVLSADKTRNALENKKVVVLGYDQDGVVDVTNEYDPSKRVLLDVADPLAADRVGRTWYPIDHGFRWMPKRASVRMQGPRSGCHTLYVSGYCVAAQVAARPLGMTVYVNGLRLAPVKIEKGDAQFEFTFPVLARTSGLYNIVIEVDRTFSTAIDKRALGLAFGRFEIR
jgi:hypothetical protein